MNCPCCNYQTAQDMAFCPKCGAHIMPLNGTGGNFQQQNDMYYRTGYPTAAPNKQALPMKWYNWLKVTLIIGAVFNILMGITHVFNPSYNLPEYTSLEYTFVDGLRASMDFLESANVVNGIFCIIMGIFMIVIQRQLVGYKKTAPVLLILFHVVNAVFLVIFCAVSVSRMEALLGPEMYDGASVWAESLSSIVVNIVMVVLNGIYFKKRAHLFVN